MILNQNQAGMQDWALVGQSAGSSLCRQYHLLEAPFVASTIYLEGDFESDCEQEPSEFTQFFLLDSAHSVECFFHSFPHIWSLEVTLVL